MGAMYKNRRGVRSFFCVVTMLMSLFVPSIAVGQQTEPENDATTPLEIRVADRPKWEKGCLTIALDRVNHSSHPLYLTALGPYFYIALDVSTDKADANEAIKWVNIYGVSDIKNLDAVPLAPGAIVHNEFCLRPTVWIVNTKRETHREISVRGKMRIDVSYFLDEVSWKRNKEWIIKPPTVFERDSSAPLPASLAPKWARIFADIPCPDTSCKSDCLKPPRGVAEEFHSVPDVYFISPAWNKRGKLLTDELARKLPPCLEDKSR